MRTLNPWPVIRDCIRRAMRKRIVRRLQTPDTIFLHDRTLSQMPVKVGNEQRLRILHALQAAGMYEIELGDLRNTVDLETIKSHLAALTESIGTVACSASEIESAAELFSDVPFFKRSVQLWPVVKPDDHQTEPVKSIEACVRAAGGHFNRIAVHLTQVDKPDSLARDCRQAISSGATTVGIVDELGILTPEKARALLRRLKDQISDLGNVLLSVGFSNRVGLALANSLACVSEGVNVVQCTLGGRGFAHGTTSLEQFSAALRAHQDQYRRSANLDENSLKTLGELLTD